MNKGSAVYRGLIITALFLVSLTPGDAATGKAVMVKIGLALNTAEIRLAAGGETALLDFGNGDPRALPWPGDQALFTAIGELIYLNEIPVGRGPLIVVPVTDFVVWDEKRYRGELIIINQNGTLNLVNRLSLENYLRGVVPKEVPAGWPMAALKAQAIAARTYTLANSERHRNDGFQLCATTHCQVYEGVDGEHPETDRAVLESDGLVITYNGRLISAVYHDTAGGYTKDAAEIWNYEVPYLKPVPAWDTGSPYSQWNRSIAWDELRTQLGKAFPELGKLRQLSPAAFSDDGRVIKLNLQGEAGERVITGEQFRQAVGLPSSHMKIGIAYGLEPLITLWWLYGQKNPAAIISEPEVPEPVMQEPEAAGEVADWPQLQGKPPVRLVINGAGRGHGVGLSQWGAKRMAEAGYNERQILEHFYPGAKLRKMETVPDIAGEFISNASK